MKTPIVKQAPELLLDCSSQEQLLYWAGRLKVSPLKIKSAVRACLDNKIRSIACYLKTGLANPRPAPVTSAPGAEPANRKA